MNSKKNECHRKVDIRRKIVQNPNYDTQPYI